MNLCEGLHGTGTACGSKRVLSATPYDEGGSRMVAPIYPLATASGSVVELVDRSRYQRPLGVFHRSFGGFKLFVGGAEDSRLVR
jgi:hypothetical protein